MASVAFLFLASSCREASLSQRLSHNIQEQSPLVGKDSMTCDSQSWPHGLEDIGNN